MSTRPLLPSLFRRIPPLPFPQYLLTRLASTSSATNWGPRRSSFNGKERQDFGHREEGSPHRGGRALPPSQTQGRDFRPSSDRSYDRSNDKSYDKYSYWDNTEFKVPRGFPHTPRTNSYRTSDNQAQRSSGESNTPFNSSYSSPNNFSIDRAPRNQDQRNRDPNSSRTSFNSSPTGFPFGRTSDNQTERSFREFRTPSNSSYSSPADSSFDRTPRNQTQRDRDPRESRTPPSSSHFLRTDPYSPRPKPAESSFAEYRPSPRLDKPSLSPDANTSSGIWNPPGSTRPVHPVAQIWSPSPESYNDAFPGFRSWRPAGRPSPRLDYVPQDVGWTPKPRRHIPKLSHDAEWIYGTSVVEAALRAGRRKMLRLYIYDGKNRSAEVWERDKAMGALAKGAGVEVIQEQDLGTLDSMSDSRPHNGYVLECLPLPKTPILSLSEAAPSKSSFSVILAKHTSTNEEIPADKYPTTIYNRDPKKRYPFVLMLDEILDPGNLGAILRSAYFFGVTAIVLSLRNCAPLSPVCLKAAAGAAEFIPILEQTRSAKFIASSIENGWTFYAAVPPVTKHQLKRDRYLLTSDVGSKLEEGPICLVLGNEGGGLRPLLKKCTQYCVSLEKAPGTDRIVDSLNVSVAAALLSNSFLKVV